MERGTELWRRAERMQKEGLENRTGEIRSDLLRELSGSIRERKAFVQVGKVIEVETLARTKRRVSQQILHGLT